MYCQKIKKYCPKNKTNYFDKTSILNENADLNQCGLSGSPTKVKTVENIVFKAKESKTLTGSDEDMNSLIQELLANHTIG